MKLADALRTHIAAIQARAAELDETAGYPAADMALLSQLGMPSAPLPQAFGGEGAGTEPAGMTLLFELLRLLGQGNLSVGRLFEAHVNVVRLAFRFGDHAQKQRVADICQTGSMFGLWVTDAPNDLVRLEAGLLSGAKGPCSGAGHVTHALITFTEDTAVRMALVDIPRSIAVQGMGDRLHGMRATAHGTVRLDNIPLPSECILGSSGDYLREPDLSTGAWRTMAVTLGGLDHLVESVRLQLRARGHDAAPLQQARFGELLIAQGTARLWTSEAAQIAESGSRPRADQVAAINLARIAVEHACLDGIRHAQRALGLLALVKPNPVERILRDLTTYLRQPAPDAVLTEAAQHALKG